MSRGDNTVDEKTQFCDYLVIRPNGERECLLGGNGPKMTGACSIRLEDVEINGNNYKVPGCEPYEFRPRLVQIRNVGEFEFAD